MEKHNPVLSKEVLEVLSPKRGEKHLDLTAGFGGHARKILAITQNYKDSVLVDRDEVAIEFLRTKCQFGEVRPEILRRDYYSAVLFLAECGRKFDLVLMDLGVSSPQLDEAERGFSFSKTGKLDMRMDRRQEKTAADIVNKARMVDLAEIFVRNGEMKPKAAQRLALEIVKNRPFFTTTELANLIAFHAKSSEERVWRGKHPATTAFQAIRIEVNDELSMLRRTLPAVLSLMNPGGRIAIISFHSLEDRIVKEFFKAEAAKGAEAELRIITKKPIVAGEVELINNPRARSAKLRGAERSF